MYEFFVMLMIYIYIVSITCADEFFLAFTLSLQLMIAFAFSSLYFQLESFIFPSFCALYSHVYGYMYLPKDSAVCFIENETVMYL